MTAQYAPPSIISRHDHGRTHDSWFGIQLGDENGRRLFFSNEQGWVPGNGHYLGIHGGHTTDHELQIHAGVHHITRCEHPLLERGGS